MAVAILAALLATQTLGAQPQYEQARAEELLRSTSIVSRAWGVFHAGRLGTPALRQRLVQQLAALIPYRDADPQSAEGALIHAVFDALIVSGTQVPEMYLMPFASKWRDEVLILLAHQGADEETLFEIRKADLTEPQWLLVNNLLLQKKPPRFFSQLLDEVEITHTILIVDGDSSGVGGGSGGGSWACGVRQMPRGFPPVGLYQLIAYAERGAIVIAKGPRDVYYRRTVAPTDGQVGWSVGRVSWNARQERLAYLAVLTKSETSRMRHLLSRVSSVHWRGNTDFERELDLLLERQASDIRSWLGDAVRLGVADVRPDRLGITANIEDRRRNATGTGIRVVKYLSAP